MRKILLIVLLISSGFFCRAQENNFIAQKGKILWESVFITSEANIPELVAKHPKLNVAAYSPTLYKGSGIDIRNTCPGSSSVLENEMSFDFEIELRDGKYRVTVFNLIFSPHRAKKDKAQKAEAYFIEKGELNAGAAQDLACIDAFFNRIFTMTNVYRNKS